jgi:hypothetical protein
VLYPHHVLFRRFRSAIIPYCKCYQAPNVFNDYILKKYLYHVLFRRFRSAILPYCKCYQALNVFNDSNCSVFLLTNFE